MAKTLSLRPRGEHKKPSLPPSMRTYQRTEKKYQDTRSSSSAMLAVGLILLHGCLFQILELERRRQLLPDGPLVLLTLSACLALLFGSHKLRRDSQQLKIQADKERQLANELVEWFITTYSCEQIDHQIEAIATLAGAPEILCLKRLDMIRILLDREYEQSFDSEFMDQLCEDIYNMIFEKEPALPQ